MVTCRDKQWAFTVPDFSLKQVGDTQHSHFPICLYTVQVPAISPDLWTLEYWYQCWLHLNSFDPWGPFYYQGFTLIEAWLSNNMISEVWDKIT